MPTRKKRRTTKAKGEASRCGRRDATESKKGNGGASASNKGRGKCGRLAAIPRMPLDILVEVSVFAMSDSYESVPDATNVM